MFKAKHYKKEEKKNLWYMYVQYNLIRLFLLNRIWISKTEIIINKKKKEEKYAPQLNKL